MNKLLERLYKLDVLVLPADFSNSDYYIIPKNNKQFIRLSFSFSDWGSINAQVDIANMENYVESFHDATCHYWQNVESDIESADFETFEEFQDCVYKFIKDKLDEIGE